ncbi:hypothetical protein NQZ68_025308 [Dissostichus eleginoides]|nr:hypothetical protein NQZ68_025308 [Dissostichus eleginoides]
MGGKAPRLRAEQLPDSRHVSTQAAFPAAKCRRKSLKSVFTDYLHKSRKQGRAASFYPQYHQQQGRINKPTHAHAQQTQTAVLR